MKPILTALALLLAATPAAHAETTLTRLDCGAIDVDDMAFFSDTFAGAGQPGELTDSCYLIDHDGTRLLWDTGFPAAILGTPLDIGPVTARLDVTVTDQLAELGLSPDDIDLVGISHYHVDHTGQAADFPNARLLIGARDLAALKAGPVPNADARTLGPWMDGGGEVTPVAADLDLFGDGSVTVLNMPGHTPGSLALLVQLAETGPVLLSGDVVHFEANFDRHGVPGFNDNRADSLASIDRLEGLARDLGATLVIQHDPSHISRLPAFPAAAR